MKKLIIANTIGILLLAGVMLWLNMASQSRQVVYVDSIRLFNDYNFKKEMYQQIERSFAPQMARMDSIDRSIASGQMAQDALHRFQGEREELSYAITNAKNETDRVIWERLNQVIKRFGDQQEYEMIIGANGMGTVLYGMPRTDITDKVTKYANKDYEGK